MGDPHEFDEEYWEEWDQWGEEHPKEAFRPKARSRLKARDTKDSTDSEIRDGEVGPRRQGLVVGIGSKICDVLDEGEVLRCAVPREMAANQRSQLAVGDEVLFSGRLHGSPMVREVLPRRTQLSRPDPLNPQQERVLAANVDLVVAVVSVVQPPLKPGLVDRILLAVGHGGAEAMVFVNKVDLLEAADYDTAHLERAEVERLELLRSHGVRVVLGSAESGRGVAELRGLTRGKTTVFVGHSGVGKSSLMNVLHPDLDLATGEVRERDGLGRHTTSQSSVHLLGEGTRLIDTPGIRQFGIWNMNPRQLAALFPEFRCDTLVCRFSDCTHVHEPGCAVRVAVETGVIQEFRYQVYRGILDSLDGD
jgi:ribosome biogenesis GTPase